jgi:hypothetical protein
MHDHPIPMYEASVGLTGVMAPKRLPPPSTYYTRPYNHGASGCRSKASATARSAPGAISSSELM